MWTIIGLGLIMWVIYDLFAGVTWTYRAIYRQKEPTLYWFITLVWMVIALLTLLY